MTLAAIKKKAIPVLCLSLAAMVMAASSAAQGLHQEPHQRPQDNAPSNSNLPI